MRFLSAFAAGLALALAFVSCGPALAKPDAATPAAAAAPDYSWVDKLPHQTGDIALATAQAKLNLGDDYYFLGPVESKRVLTELWRNPPDAADGVLGMIFPKSSSPMDKGAWGAVVTYDDSGYVSDDDAAKIDPPKLLGQLRSHEADENEARKKGGYESLHLVGWADPPSYDKATHSAIWARDVQFGNDPQHTLNYNIRILGRRGVLSLNVVAPLASLAQVRQVSAHVRQLAAYDPGSRYADVDKKNDKMAAYGVAGMIAAGVGLAAAKKIGLLGLLLVFGKKAFLLIAAAAAGIGARFRGLFGKKKVAAPPPPSSSGGGPDIVQ